MVEVRPTDVTFLNAAVAHPHLTIQSLKNTDAMALMAEQVQELRRDVPRVYGESGAEFSSRMSSGTEPANVVEVSVNGPSASQNVLRSKPGRGSPRFVI